MTTTPEQLEQPAEIELTPREIAIASGQDPEKAVEKTEKLPEAPEAAQTDPGTEAENGEGTDALETPAVAGKIEPTWLTAEVEQEAESYGLSKDDLLDLGDEDAYRRTKRVLDRNLYASGQQAKTAPPAARADAPPPEAAKPAVEKLGKGQKYDLEKMKAEGYDENVLGLFEQANEMRERLDAQERDSQQRLYEAHIQEFNTAADTLDADLFGKNFQDGKPVKISKTHDENRQKLYDAAETIVAGIVAKASAAGQSPRIPPMPMLLARARDYAFADSIRERANKQRTASLAAQTRQRRPPAGKSVRTAPSAAVEKDPIKAIANSPEIIDFFAKSQEANGVAA